MNAPLEQWRGGWEARRIGSREARRPGSSEARKPGGREARMLESQQKARFCAAELSSLPASSPINK